MYPENRIPLIKEYTLNYRGLNFRIYGMFLNLGVLGSLGEWPYEGSRRVRIGFVASGLGIWV